MTVCSECCCTHPACWKAELDFKRSVILNEYGYFNVPEYFNNTNGCKYDVRNERIVQVDGSLPTYKTLDLLESGFPSPYCSKDLGSKHDVDDECDEIGKHSDGETFRFPEIPNIPSPRREEDRRHNNSYPFTNASLSKYLRKLCHQQPLKKEEEKTEGEKKEDAGLDDAKRLNTLVFKTLDIDHVRSFGNEYTKVYTWVPGNKTEDGSAEEDEEGESKEKGVAMKMIDGADLPTTRLSSDENKHRHKLPSQSGALSAAFHRRRTVQVPPLGSAEHDDYLELLRYINLTRLKCDKISLNNDVRIPSALQTARVKLYESTEDNKTPRYVSKPKYNNTSATPPIETTSHDQEQLQQQQTTTTPPPHSAMHLPDTLLKSLKKPENRGKHSKRTPLPLTRVSVPKKVVRRLPLFDHCSSSIKKTDLPDVSMEPLSGSETTSIMSMDKTEIVHSCTEPHFQSRPESLRIPSPGMGRVPPASPYSMVSEASPSPSHPENGAESPIRYHIPPNNSPLEEKTSQLGNAEKQCPPGTSRTKHPDKAYLDLDTENKLHADKSQHTASRVAPSAIMISKASRTDGSEQQPQPLSPTLSLGSKSSYDGWLLDKDIISRTYDQYHSFTPFKTPHCSAHVMRNERNAESRVSTSKRQILPPSLHNLDQYLPDNNETLQNTPSYVTRCLSPSRSMFIRQQKQPPIENVPSEIMVSRFPLLPAITRSQVARSPRQEAFEQQKHNFTDMSRPVSSKTDHPNIQGEFMDDDFEDEVEEVLLNKEVFSSYALAQMNSGGNTEVEVTTQDPSVMAIQSMQSDNNEEVDLSVRNSKWESLNVKPAAAPRRPSLNVADISRRPSLQSGSNFLLIPNQGSAMVVTTQQDVQGSTSLMSKPDNGITMESAYGSSSSHVNNDIFIEQVSGREASANGGVSTIEILQHSDQIQRNTELTEENTGHLSAKTEVTTEDTDTNPKSTVLSPITSGPSLQDIDHAALECSDEPTEPQTSTANGRLNSSNDSGRECPLSALTEASDDDEENSADDELDGTCNDVPIDDVAVDDQFYGSSEENPSGDNCEVVNDEVVITNETDGMVVEGNIATVNEIDSKLANAGNIEENTVGNETSQSTEHVTAIDESASESALEPAEELRSKTSLKSNPAADSLASKESGNFATSNNGSTLSVDMYKGSSLHLPDSPFQSVMYDIFQSQVKEGSSLYLTPSHADDFMEGLDLDLEVDEEIVRAIHGLEEFVLDSYEIEEEEEGNKDEIEEIGEKEEEVIKEEDFEEG